MIFFLFHYLIINYILHKKFIVSSHTVILLKNTEDGEFSWIKKQITFI